MTIVIPLWVMLFLKYYIVQLVAIFVTSIVVWFKHRDFLESTITIAFGIFPVLGLYVVINYIFYIIRFDILQPLIQRKIRKKEGR